MEKKLQSESTLSFDELLSPPPFRWKPSWILQLIRGASVPLESQERRVLLGITGFALIVACMLVTVAFGLSLTVQWPEPLHVVAPQLNFGIPFLVMVLIGLATLFKHKMTIWRNKLRYPKVALKIEQLKNKKLVQEPLEILPLLDINKKQLFIIPLVNLSTDRSLKISYCILDTEGLFLDNVKLFIDAYTVYDFAHETSVQAVKIQRTTEISSFPYIVAKLSNAYKAFTNYDRIYATQIPAEWNQINAGIKAMLDITTYLSHFFIAMSIYWYAAGDGYIDRYYFEDAQRMRQLYSALSARITNRLEDMEAAIQVAPAFLDHISSSAKNMGGIGQIKWLVAELESNLRGFSSWRTVDEERWKLIEYLAIQYRKNLDHLRDNGFEVMAK
jgi:hypothetical protein